MCVNNTVSIVAYAFRRSHKKSSLKQMQGPERSISASRTVSRILLKEKTKHQFCAETTPSAQAHVRWTERQWKDVLWSHKSTFVFIAFQKKKKLGLYLIILAPYFSCCQQIPQKINNVVILLSVTPKCPNPQVSTKVSLKNTEQIYYLSVWNMFSPFI